MFDNHFTLSDIHIEVIDTADKYMKGVLVRMKGFDHFNDAGWSFILGAQQ